MGSQYQIAEETVQELRKWYRKIGYTDEESADFSSFVFSHAVEVSSYIPAPSGWEIEYRAPIIRTNVKKTKHQVYAHWMKGGWNRVGAWESVPENDEEVKASYIALPRFGWNNSTGMSADYYHYMQQCKRKVEEAWLDPQDALYGIHVSNPVRLSQLSLGVEVYADEKDLCVCAEVLEKSVPAMHHVFVVDISGSMRSRWVLVQLSMAALFKMLPHGSKVSIIAFSDHCQIIKQGITSGDTDGFMKALRQIPLSGGFLGALPVLQTAFGVLRSMGQNGIVTLFTDNTLRCGFASQDICNDYIREERAFGNRLHLVCYGSDSWHDEQLCKMGEIGGRMRTVLSPENVQNLQDQHWEVMEDRIYDFQIHPDGGAWQLLGGNTDVSGCLDYFPITPGHSAAAAFINSTQIAPGDVIPLCVEWKDEHDVSFIEKIKITVKPTTKRVTSAIREAFAMQALKNDPREKQHES